jgi:hypothetical protein
MEVMEPLLSAPKFFSGLGHGFHKFGGAIKGDISPSVPHFQVFLAREIDPHKDCTGRSFRE